MVLMLPVPGQDAENAVWLEQQQSADFSGETCPTQSATCSGCLETLFRSGRDNVLAYVRKCLELP